MSDAEESIKYLQEKIDKLEEIIVKMINEKGELQEKIEELDDEIMRRLDERWELEKKRADKCNEERKTFCFYWVKRC